MSESKQAKSRREFIRTSIAGIGALTILPSTVIAGLGHRAPSDKLNIAAVGIGGIGYQNLINIESENIVALCDVDWDYGQKSFRRWSNASKYKDFRVMLENEKGIDAVLIATPDHTHSVVAMAAMQLQKHVYVQSPMAHSIFEARRMNETARVFNVVSQVGNPCASGDEIREICELIWSGAIGEIKEVYAWSSDPLWKQGDFYPDKKLKIPKDLDWDLFLGPAEDLPYHSTYTPYGWRAWWRFGNGVLGTSGSQILEPVFKALKLNSPVEVFANSTKINLDSAPAAQQIVFEFDRRDNLPKLSMPGVKLFWYDGGLKPELPDGIPNDVKIGNEKGGLIFKGSDGLLICGSEGVDFAIVKNGKKIQMNVDRTLHRIVNPFTGGHELDWVRACKESVSNRLNTSANFDSQSALTETILVGALAVRLQSLKKKLQWDSSQMKFLNIDFYEEFEVQKSSEMYIQNGVTKFDVELNKYNAYRFVNQTVRPIYRNGWQQI